MHLLFFVNPKSGGKSKSRFVKDLEQYLDASRFTWDLAEWTDVDFEVASIQGEIDKADALIAVGGDGTVNYLGQVCMRYGKSLGIIALGSGNGFARHLGLPLESEAAIRRLNQATLQRVDAIKVDNRWCFNISGIGFDAHVAHEYAKTGSRRLMGYARLIVMGLGNFRPIGPRVVIDGVLQKQRNLFMMGVANGSQWGYGFSINGEGCLDDGVMEVYMIGKLPIWKLPGLLMKSRKSRLHEAREVTLTSAAKLQISDVKPIKVHIDGEPYTLGNQVDMVLEKGAVEVFY